jgi:hypothetical protein
MRLRVSASVLALAVLSSLVFASGALAATHVTMKPGAGKPTTRFVASFRAPAQTGVFATVSSHYQLSASGPKGKRCVSSTSINLRPTKLHAHVKVTMRPRGHGGVWCSGKFHGKIREFQSIVCRRINACPDIVIAPRTIARFSFTVKKAKTGGGQSAVPTFAGLQSVTTCRLLIPQGVPGPQQQTYTLKWSAASDPGTSGAQMVYQVFYSSTSGGEDYSTPNWTTPAGVTTFTAILPGFGPFYFVVRARDKAGREDHNTVQHTAVNTC